MLDTDQLSWLRFAVAATPGFGGWLADPAHAPDSPAVAFTRWWWGRPAPAVIPDSLGALYLGILRESRGEPPEAALAALDLLVCAWQAYRCAVPAHHPRTHHGPRLLDDLFGPQVSLTSAEPDWGQIDLIVALDGATLRRLPPADKACWARRLARLSWLRSTDGQSPFMVHVRPPDAPPAWTDLASDFELYRAGAVAEVAAGGAPVPLRPGAVAAVIQLLAGRHAAGRLAGTRVAVVGGTLEADVLEMARGLAASGIAQQVLVPLRDTLPWGATLLRDYSQRWLHPAWLCYDPFDDVPGFPFDRRQLFVAGA